jgi:histidine triad (HIT) family protein
MADCVFCSILAGETPAHFVGRGGGWAAFLDRTPLFHGHVLVVPSEHRETLLDVNEAELAAVMGAAQRVARAVGEALGCQGTFVAMNNKVSQSVPHLHVHVVPRTKGDGLKGFFWPRTKYKADAEMVEVAARIAAVF